MHNINGHVLEIQARFRVFVESMQFGQVESVRMETIQDLSIFQHLMKDKVVNLSIKACLFHYVIKFLLVDLEVAVDIGFLNHLM